MILNFFGTCAYNTFSAALQLAEAVIAECKSTGLEIFKFIVLHTVRVEKKMH